MKSIRTGSEVYTPKLSWFMYVDTFLKRNNEMNVK